jgi:hypothetical protein
MTFKKHKGQIFDVELTPKEQKVLNEKINEQIIATHQQFTDDFDYMILKVLHDHFGFGLQRLRKAYNFFVQDNEALIKHYEMPDAGVYIARREMNAIGCNVEEWNKERGE